MAADATSGAGRREWIGLAVIALPCLLYSMDLTVLELAVPKLSADLAPTSSQLLWIMDVYGFMIAGFLITMGTLGDRIGRRRLLLMGAFAFGVASVLAAVSTSAEMLIASRAVLGVAGATLAPSTLSLIRAMFAEPRQRTVAIAVWATSFSAGAAIGPLAGGVLLEYFWWGSVFLLALPVMALLLVLGPIVLPEYRDPDAGRLDLISAALSLIAVLTVIYGLKQLAEDSAGWQPLLSIATGVAVGVVFARRQQTLADPLIDLQHDDGTTKWRAPEVVARPPRRTRGGSMLLEAKNAVVNGAGGSVGGAVARAFAREGARVFLVGRTLAPLDEMADDISADGGVVDTAQVDALDARALDEHADAVAREVGGIDIAFDALSNDDVQGRALIDLPCEDFARPVMKAIRTRFLTTRAVARHMVKHRSGVIVTVTGGYREAFPAIGGTVVAWAALEALCRQWACELGPLGIRVVWLRTTGIPDSIPDTATSAPDTGRA
jgi:MFS family permease